MLKGSEDGLPVLIRSQEGESRSLPLCVQTQDYLVYVIPTLLVAFLQFTEAL